MKGEEEDEATSSGEKENGDRQWNPIGFHGSWPIKGRKPPLKKASRRVKLPAMKGGEEEKVVDSKEEKDGDWLWNSIDETQSSFMVDDPYVDL